MNLAELFSQAQAVVNTRKASTTPADHEKYPAAEWYLQRYVARTWRSMCACGAVSAGLEGIYAEEQHLRLHCKRWVRMPAPALDEGIPRATETKDEHTETCLQCLSQLNFPEA